MEKQLIHTDKAPQAIGPYAQAVLASGKTLYISGQIPIDPATGQIVPGGVSEQAAQCMKNVQAILSEASATFDNVVKTTVFIKSMDDFGQINEVYGQYITGNYPARACVEVARLPKDCLLYTSGLQQRQALQPRGQEELQGS